MANDKKKFQKKKEREKAVRKKVLNRREAIRAKRVEDAEKERALDVEADPTLAQKVKPFMKEETKEEQIRRRLEHNMKILEALEQEYLAEQDKRQKANEELESQGHHTIKEKMDALQEKALELMEEHGIDVDIPSKSPKIKLGGSADVRVDTTENE